MRLLKEQSIVIYFIGTSKVGSFKTIFPIFNATLYKPSIYGQHPLQNSRKKKKENQE